MFWPLSLARYDQFTKWESLSKYATQQPATDAVQNLSLLVQELTRPEPNGRLDIKDFNELIKNVEKLNLKQFKNEIFVEKSKEFKNKYATDQRSVQEQVEEEQQEQTTLSIS